MTTHKYPAVLPPQAQEAIHDIISRLQHYLEQRETAYQELQRQNAQLSASLNTTRAALLVAVAEAERANARADAAERRIEAMTPDDYESPEALIRDIMRENSLFTYQSAERGFLLRESIGRIREPHLIARIRIVLDTPEDAEKRGKAERALGEALLGVSDG